MISLSELCGVSLNIGSFVHDQHDARVTEDKL